MSQSNSEIKSFMARRRFLSILASGTALAFPTGWSYAARSNLWVPDDLPLTPTQTEGPFYPKPSIEQQLFNDTDLTRKLPNDTLAQGQPVTIAGVVMDRKGRPLNHSIVEIWQASSAGLYNHPQDSAKDPKLDRDFQFWGRAVTGEDGRYNFSTIIPGEYTGRSARHIHYRIDSPGYRRLTTQSYFANFGKRNERDGLYKSLNRNERALVTVGFEEHVNKPWNGTFNVVLADI